MNDRKQKLKKNLLVRAVILCILTLVEGLIISSTRSRWRFALALLRRFTWWLVQMWPLMHPPRDSADASVYSVWAICPLTGYVAGLGTFTDYVPAADA